MLDALIVLLIAATFIGLWTINVFFFSKQSGWRFLSKRFQVESEYLADVKRVTRLPYEICLRYWADYSSFLWIAPTEEGLYLSVVFPFRPWHPPLLIPWNEISWSQTKVLWRRYLVLLLGNAERIPLRISKRAASKLGITDGMHGQIVSLL